VTENKIKIENLLKGTNPTSMRIIDIKIGTSTLTKRGKLKGAQAYRD